MKVRQGGQFLCRSRGTNGEFSKHTVKHRRMQWPWKGLELEEVWGPFQPKPFWDSGVLGWWDSGVLGFHECKSWWVSPGPGGEGGTGCSILMGMLDFIKFHLGKRIIASMKVFSFCVCPSVPAPRLVPACRGAQQSFGKECECWQELLVPPERWRMLSLGLDSCSGKKAGVSGSCLQLEKDFPLTHFSLAKRWIHHTCRVPESQLVL